MEKIMIIDGNSIINRAFYGVPVLTNKSGEFTNAIYGFLNIFFKLYDEENPKYIAVAFDLKAPTFRHKMYPEYKGTRHAMPEELRPQIPMLKEVLKAMNIKICELEGFEADDILGTLAKKAEKEGLEPVIVSGDRDLLQIASDKIKIRIPKTKGGKTEIEDYYAKDVLEKYSVTPEEFIDVKALMGDSSDNVPGVPSIGEKTAIKIIMQYKNIENAFENADNIKPKKASENIIIYKEQAILSKKLVTIEINVPIEFNKENFAVGEMYNEESLALFQRHNFKSMLLRFDKKVAISKEKEFDFKYIENEIDAKGFVNEINPWGEIGVFVVSEDDEIIGFAVTDEENEGVFISAEKMSKNAFEDILKYVFEGENKKICFDAKNVMSILKKYNVCLKNFEFDTLIASYLIDSSVSNYSCQEMADRFLNENYLSDEQILGKGKSAKRLISLSQNELTDVFCKKSNIIYRAYNVINEKLNKMGLADLYKTIEHPLITVLFSMEQAGIFVDKEELLQYRDELDKLIEQLTKEIYWCAGEEFNINSPKQLGMILFEKLGLKGGKKTKTGWSTAADVLEKLADKDEIVKRILDYRTYSKLKSTYADGLLNVRDEKSGRIYSTFNQTITTTGRISSTEPNLQNIPIKLEFGHKLRKTFKPKEGYSFIDADYSQIELRVLAHLADEKLLIDAFNNGADIHALTASQVFGVEQEEVTALQRRMAKVVNFGILYGKQGFSLSQDLNISKKEADLYIEQYFSKYKNVKKLLDDIVEEARKKGYVSTMFGRIRPIPDINATNFMVRSAAERMAMNMPIQGTAADIIKVAMVKLYERLKKENLRSEIILQVHDELLIEAPDDECEYATAILKEEMENAVKLKVPLEVDVHIGKTWYDTK